MSPEDRIAQLEAENAALRQSQGNSRGPVHPDVPRQYFNGSVVLHEGRPHRVLGTSIDWDGNVTYDLAPVSGDVVHVTPDKRVERFSLEHESARAALPGIRTYDVTHDASARAYDVPESDLEAFHAHDTQAYADAAEARIHARQAGIGGDGVGADEAVAVERS